MLFTIICKDAPDSLEKRKPHSREHVARLKQLKDQGRLVIAGPLTKTSSENTSLQGVRGSLIVAEFASLEQAKIWVNNDPFKHAGVYASTEIFPFKKILV